MKKTASYGARSSGRHDVKRIIRKNELLGIVARVIQVVLIQYVSKLCTFQYMTHRTQPNLNMLPVVNLFAISSANPYFKLSNYPSSLINKSSKNL